MTPREFTYWLQGYFEISESSQLTQKQTTVIKDHLALVFDKQTPDRDYAPSIPVNPFIPPPMPQPMPQPINPDKQILTEIICSAGDNPNAERTFC